MHARIDELVMKPTRHFDRPDDVLSYPGLKHRDRVRILESWKLDAQRLAESTSENMTGGEETNLSEVSKALLQLKEMENVPVAIQGEDGRPVVAGMAIGGLIGAGAGLVATAGMTTVSLSLIVQTSVVGLIMGGVAGALRREQQRKEL